MIAVRNVSHNFDVERYRDVPALSNVSLTIEDGKFVSLLGPSGCGKTTLLRIIDGLIRPTSGQVTIDGTPVVRTRTSSRTMVFQEFNLLPWRNARKNIEFALELHGVPRRERRPRAEAALRRVGLERFASYYPHQLSGGMKQRVGLARALSTNPQLLLMDEPFGALDPLVRELLQLDLLKVLEEQALSIVFVTHSVDEAVFLSDQIVIFRSNPGQIVTTIDVDLPKQRWKRDEEIKASPEFVRYRKEIWHLLKEQMQHAA